MPHSNSGGIDPIQMITLVNMPKPYPNPDELPPSASHLRLIAHRFRSHSPTIRLPVLMRSRTDAYLTPKLRSCVSAV